MYTDALLMDTLKTTPKCFFLHNAYGDDTTRTSAQNMYTKSRNALTKGKGLGGDFGQKATAAYEANIRLGELFAHGTPPPESIRVVLESGSHSGPGCREMFVFGPSTAKVHSWQERLFDILNPSKSGDHTANKMLDFILECLEESHNGVRDTEPRGTQSSKMRTAFKRLVSHTLGYSRGNKTAHVMMGQHASVSLQFPGGWSPFQGSACVASMDPECTCECAACYRTAAPPHEDEEPSTAGSAFKKEVLGERSGKKRPSEHEESKTSSKKPKMDMKPAKSHRPLALAAAPGPARLDPPKRDSKGPQAPLTQQKQLSMFQFVQVHHSTRAPSQATRCGVLCCLTVTRIRVLLVVWWEQMKPDSSKDKMDVDAGEHMDEGGAVALPAPA